MHHATKSLWCCVAVFTLALVPLQAQDAKKAGGIEGIWLGPIKAGEVELRLAFHVTQKEGKLSATMDSLDQAVKGLPVTEVVFKDGTVRFELKNVGEFEGKLNKEGTEIAGEWRQGGANLPLTLKRVKALPTPARPQEPKRPFPYREEEVRYENKKAKIKLAGTLTLPKGDGPFPVVLLITGSGAQDRNEEILGHKPFLLISDYLTRRGIGVLRLDDRGVGGSTGNVSTSTTADFAEDVQVGIDFLKTHKEIDAKKIGLIGHSEGGIVAPMVAAKSKDVAFIILLAGTGLPGDEILMLQNKLLLEAAGAPKAAVDVQLKLLSISLPIAKQEADAKLVDKRIREEIAKWKEQASEEEKKYLAEHEAGALKILINKLTSPWDRYFITHDPRPALGKVQCPVLAVNGEKDLQVPCKANLDAIAKALKEGGNKAFTIKEFPKLNHLFQTCKTGSIGEYAVIEETMAPVVLETMSEWILSLWLNPLHPID